MHGSGRSQGWLVHLIAGAALGAVIVLVIWIFSGGRPFGEVVGTSDVSSPTTAATAKTAAGAPAERASQLASEPPKLPGESTAAELRFIKKAKRPAKAERRVAAKKPKRPARRKKARHGPVVRVVAPPAEQQTPETPVAVVPSPAPTAAPKPVSPPPSPGGGGGGAPAKPKAPGPTLWAGEG